MSDNPKFWTEAVRTLAGISDERRRHAGLDRAADHLDAIINERSEELAASQRENQELRERLERAEKSMTIARNVFEGMAAFYREQRTSNNDAIAALSQDMSARMNAAVKALNAALTPVADGADKGERG